MTRQVFLNSMVAHIWAQQDQPAGRSNNGQFFFEGRKLYSYGSHFVVGVFVDLAKGGKAVILNSRDYSVTTSRHKSYAHSALHGLGLPIFYIDGASDNHAANLQALQDKALAFLTAAERERQPRERVKSHESKREACLAAAAETMAKATEYAAAFGIKWRPVPAAWKRQAKAAAKAAAAALVAREAERVRYEAQRRSEEAVDFRAWQAGQSNYCPSSYARDEAGSVYMRIAEGPEGAELQTSMGARVPLRHAVKVFRFVKACRERGEGWRANGRVIRVGHFTVTEITAAGDMVAGCHRFSWAQMCAAATAAGVVDMEPSAEAVEPRASL